MSPLIHRSLVAASLISLLACQREGATPTSSTGRVSGAADANSVPEQAAVMMSPRPSEAVAPPSADIPTNIAMDSVVPSMIIRTGQAFIEVDSLELGIAQVQRLAATVGGFIANSSIQTGEGQQRMATLEIKVPASRYDQAVSGLAAIGKLVSSNTSAQDVGEEFVDVTARVANARRLEERLISLLATRTGKLDDVLAVERELARVREEIERYEGRLRYLRSKVSVSTLTVTVAEPGPVVGEPGSNVMVEAFKRAWRNFVSVIAGGIEMLGAVIPVLVLGVLGWLAWRRWIRRPAKIETSHE